jgi:hypothetical protein
VFTNIELSNIEMRPPIIPKFNPRIKGESDFDAEFLNDSIKTVPHINRYASKPNNPVVTHTVNRLFSIPDLLKIFSIMIID